MAHSIRYLFILLISLSGCFRAASGQGDQALQPAVPKPEKERYVARLQLHTPEEMEAVFKRLESLIESGEKFPDFEPITFILHGPELRVFNRKNYQMYKHIVGLAARLEAFNAVDIRVCELQMKREGIKMGDLPAFVDTVPDGPAEVRRLLRRGYEYF